jgi:hypothetical protein
MDDLTATPRDPNRYVDINVGDLIASGPTDLERL